MSATITISRVAPLHRAIVVVDVEDSTTRTDPQKARLRRALYRVLDNALLESGIAERHRDRHVDRGDGALMLIHPTDQVPKTVLLGRLVPALADLIARHNGVHPRNRFRLRVTVHAGDVLYDDQGPFGEAVDLACRLLDSPELKSAMRSTAGPLVLAVSDSIYQSIVRHGYSGVDYLATKPAIHTKLCGQSHRGWILIPPHSAAGDHPHATLPGDSVRLLTIPDFTRLEPNRDNSN